MKEILNKAFQRVTEYQEKSKSALKEIERLKTSFEEGKISKLSSQIESAGLKSALDALNLNDIYNNLKESFKKYTDSLRMEFDTKFLSACKVLKLSDVKGNNMDGFSIRGILRVRIDFSKNITELLTSASPKKIETLDPEKIAQESKKELDRLFDRPFDAKSFQDALYKAYQKLKTGHQEGVLLKDVHRILWVERQKDNFFELSDPSKMIKYPLDEYSVDLDKFMNLKVQTCTISLGSGGINIYSSDGNFNSYKFLEFRKEA